MGDIILHKKQRDSSALVQQGNHQHHSTRRGQQKQSSCELRSEVVLESHHDDIHVIHKYRNLTDVFYNKLKYLISSCAIVSIRESRSSRSSLILSVDDLSDMRLDGSRVVINLLYSSISAFN